MFMLIPTNLNNGIGWRFTHAILNVGNIRLGAAPIFDR